MEDLKLDKNTRFLVKISTYIRHKDSDTAILLKEKIEEITSNKYFYNIPANLLSSEAVVYNTFTPLSVRIYKQSSHIKNMIELEKEITIDYKLED